MRTVPLTPITWPAMRRASAAAALLALAGSGGPGAEANSVSAVTVKPKPVCMEPRHPADKSVPPPEVISTYPAQGATVRPGLLVIRLTFNVAMSCDGIFLAIPPLPKPCADKAIQDLLLSYDRRTIRMTCHVAKSTRYGLRMNYDPGLDAARLNPVSATKVMFMSLAGAPLGRFELSFSTSSGPEITSVQEAKAEEAAASSQDSAD